ncbi:HdeD family acid-resistance protein [Phenylobacterium sp.]|uniref:HdeD family acid-resistance protein n=1 Tax=Phenylobacterium sp. TaxID=1871053 RepID=UPI00391C5A7C
MTTAPSSFLHSPAHELVGRAWPVLALRGIGAILFGVAAYTWPGVGLLSVIWLFGAYAAFDGLASLAAATRGGRAADRWWLVFMGVVSLGAAAIAFLWPGVTAMTLVVVIALWSIVRGLAEITGAVVLRKDLRHEWALALAGLLSTVFGVALFMAPLAGIFALLWLVAGWAILFGVLNVTWALRLRALNGG